jgi:hypothetical protein
MLDIEGIDHISDEMRAVVESEWPELVHKLPSKKPQELTTRPDDGRQKKAPAHTGASRTIRRA